MMETHKNNEAMTSQSCVGLNNKGQGITVDFSSLVCLLIGKDDGHAVALLVEALSRKVVGSIPDDVI
jgi:hypothetical protein